MHLNTFALAVLLLVSALFAGCASNKAKPVADTSGRPAWIDDPGTGVSAYAAYHVMGTQAQEELAITRARDEFAKRYGVKLNSASDTAITVVNDRSTSVSTKNIKEEVKDKEVKAMVRAKWRDPDSGSLWVWLVPSP